MSSTHVDLQIDGPRATITFSSDKGVSVLSSEVLHSFGALIARVGSQPDVRTLVVAAEGKVFIAGADIKEMRNFGPAEAREYGQLGQDVFRDLELLPCITVAAINGAALGGGLELALACDFRVAVKSAKLGLPETSLGLIPGWGGISRLSKLIGPARAKRFFLSASPESAEVGHDVGMINEIVNHVEELSPRLASFVKTFERASPQAIALAKRAWREADDIGAFADCFKTQHAREGIAAFIEKRPASWMENADV